MFVKTDKYQIEVLNNGIIRTEVFSFSDIKEQDLHDVTAIYKDRLKIKEGYFMVIIGGSIKHEISLFVDFSDPERNRIRKAEAIVSDDLMNWTKTDFYKKVFAVDHPIQFFSKESEAISWLLNLKNK